jgi:hypothetical protein
MSDLRNRIIAAIRSEQTGTNEEIADAVIAELGLTWESAQDGFEPIDDLPAGVYRYVTDFTTDD